MSRQNIIIIVLILITLGAWVLLRQTGNEVNSRYKIVASSDNYQEFLFDLGTDRDLGFTHRALDILRSKEKLLDQNSKTIADVEMEYIEVPMKDQAKGIYEKRKHGDDVYELRAAGSVKSGIAERFVMLKNGKALFEKDMAYGAEGPVMDWRIVEGKPAFTLSISSGNIAAGETKNINWRTDIYYDNEFLEQKYHVKNPRYLFSYHGKLGFIATDDTGERIFFDGKFITTAFERIHAHNCCSYMEILPTLYENGTLLFYGQRDIENYQTEKNYIVEVKL